MLDMNRGASKDMAKRIDETNKRIDETNKGLIL
jgi:hypothetical protein